MSEVERILDQLQRAFEGEAWHGPPLKKVLANLTAVEAARRPILRAHTIWEIVLHVAAWEDVVRRQLGGEVIPVASVTGEQDWPPVTDTSEAAWRTALESLERGQGQLREAIARTPEHRLVETVPGANYSFYVLLHGVIQHDLYHAGQIALLRKGGSS